MTEVSDYRIAAASREEWAARALRAEDKVKELTANIITARHTLSVLARWLDITDEELRDLPPENIPDDHRHVQREVNAALAQLMGKNG